MFANSQMELSIKSLNMKYKYRQKDAYMAVHTTEEEKLRQLLNKQDHNSLHSRVKILWRESPHNMECQ